jgi:malate dehydrogenase (oxaloacetate-decarboxylating)(NADP+)
VISGAGASAISCAELAISWGVKRENIMLCDSKGVVYKGRTVGMNKYKERFLDDKDARTFPTRCAVQMCSMACRSRT